MTEHDRTPLDDGTVERLLTRGQAPGEPALGHAMTQLRTLAERPVPRPNGALADLLDHGFEPTVVPLRRPTTPTRRWAVRTGAAVSAAAASVLIAGTAAALPPAMQDTVAELVSALTPFELPRSSPGAELRPAAPARTEDAAPSGGAASSEAPAPSRSPEPPGTPSPVPSGIPSAVPPASAPTGPGPAAPTPAATQRTGSAADQPAPVERRPDPPASESAGGGAAGDRDVAGSSRPEPTGSAAPSSPVPPGPTRP